MFKAFRVRNVQEAYLQGVNFIGKHGVIEDSRVGPVQVASGPVMTEYARPLERVLFDDKRDANPFFHLMEAMWMLAGRNDVETIQYFNARMSLFSDDSLTFNAAYGHRWRRFFGTDQVVNAIKHLREDPLSRRCVIQMWKGGVDGMGASKDFPCNTAVYFRARREILGSQAYTLDMTITNRSNDIIWGAYGANAVHMSILQEFVAAMCGMQVGRMYQLSNNYHAYCDVLKKVGEPSGKASKMYAHNHVQATRLFETSRHQDPASVLEALEEWWLDGEVDGYTRVLMDAMTDEGYATIEAMRQSWHLWKDKERVMGITNLSALENDWSLAGIQWLQRRQPGFIGQ